MHFKKIDLLPGDLPAEYRTHEYKRDEPHKEPVVGDVTINLSSVIEGVLGPCGRMLSESKSEYLSRFKDDNERRRSVYFNACIFDENGNQIWFGDLDLKDDLSLLQEAVKKTGTFFVTPEQPFRFNGLESGDMTDVVKFEP